MNDTEKQVLIDRLVAAIEKHKKARLRRFGAETPDWELWKVLKDED